MVIWIIGLSASGKTTLGKEVTALWKKQAPNTVFVDGDDVRAIFQQEGEGAYTLDERKKNAERICRLCAWLDAQGMNVVCSILSLFEESREWNRKNLSKYFEVFIDVPLELLKARETKGIYAAAERGEVKNVAGVDIPFTPPKSPDFIFDNRKNNTDFTEVACKILNVANKL